MQQQQHHYNHQLISENQNTCPTDFVCSHRSATPKIDGETRMSRDDKIRLQKLFVVLSTAMANGINTRIEVESAERIGTNPSLACRVWFHRRAFASRRLVHMFFLTLCTFCLLYIERDYEQRCELSVGDSSSWTSPGHYPGHSCKRNVRIKVKKTSKTVKT